MLTKEKLSIIVPTSKVVADIDIVVNEINAAFPDASVNTVAMFIAQCAHESGGFVRKVENLNYSSDSLLKLFGKYFNNDKVIVNGYHRQPERIANVIYANRMGNGSTESGDGWRYRGRGYIQLTGKSNYIECGKGLDKDLIKTPEYLETVEGAIKSAIWYWNWRKLNDAADEGDIVLVTKRINGGTHGLEARTAYYERARETLKPK